MNKKTARELVRNRKKQMTAEEIEAKSKCIVEKVVACPQYKQADTLYCYVSYNQEVMTKPLIFRALKEGKKVAVPKVTDRKIEFIYLTSLEELSKGFQGIEESIGTEIARADKVLMVMPGLAFDKLGNRVGYGGGFYDRYLEEHKETAFFKLAVAFDFQIMEYLEMGDKQVDMILTEEQNIFFF